MKTNKELAIDFEGSLRNIKALTIDFSKRVEAETFHNRALNEMRHIPEDDDRLIHDVTGEIDASYEKIKWLKDAYDYELQKEMEKLLELLVESESK